MKKLLLLCLFIFGMFLPNYAQTYHNTNITSDAIWYPIGNPHIVDGNFSVSTGVTLTISAGCIVKFNSSRYITISGTLNAVGTVNDSILFTLNDGQSGTWNYLNYSTGSSGTISYSKFEQGNYTIYLNGSNLVTINNCLFENNSYGLRIYNSAIVELYNSILENNNYGIYVNVSSPLLHGNLITGNGDYGLKLNGSCIPDLGTIATEGNSIYNNGTYDIYNGTEDISALYNYWGPIGHFMIPGRIYDVDDDDGLGEVFYVPWGNASHTLALTQGDPPTDLLISQEEGIIQLNWTAAPDATFYEVYTCSHPDTMLTSWTQAATEVYDTNWSKTGDPLKEFYFILSIIGE
ncbi:MAG: hypothetical protein APR54_03480 [Candidatus Cloacimonas sp. SDB]|nr:MAG: hypothetical protein APR54_03480 [Candidatus Cloacimonas sp. SDB]